MNQRKLKEGAIKRYKPALLGSSWKDCYAYLFSDSTFIWYKEKGDTKPLGSIILKFVAPYVCASEMTLKMPIEKPSLPSKTSTEQLLAIGKDAKAETVYWFLFPDSDLNSWVEQMLTTVPKVAANNLAQSGALISQPTTTTVIEKHYNDGGFGYYHGWNGFGYGYYPQYTTVNNYNSDSTATANSINDGRDSGLGDVKTESDDNTSKGEESNVGNSHIPNEIGIGAVSDSDNIGHNPFDEESLDNEQKNQRTENVSHSEENDKVGVDQPADTITNNTHIDASSDNGAVYDSNNVEEDIRGGSGVDSSGNVDSSAK